MALSTLDNSNNGQFSPSTFGTWGDFWGGAGKNLSGDVQNPFTWGGAGTGTLEQLWKAQAQKLTSMADSLGSFPSSQKAVSNLAKTVGSWSEGFGWAGVVMTISGAAYGTWQEAHDPATTSQGPTHFFHEMAGS